MRVSGPLALQGSRPGRQAASKSGNEHWITQAAQMIRLVFAIALRRAWRRRQEPDALVVADRFEIHAAVSSPVRIQLRLYRLTP